MKKYLPVLPFLSLFLLIPFVSLAAVLYSQAVTLSPGWNIVSTPRLLDSHSFSAAETSANFDIYVLDATQPSQWATMAAEGQTEFTPLTGYFINNKTGANQTLTFNYLASTTPNQQLFSKTFSTPGWYSIGVANPTYALPVGTAASIDTNNPNKILNALTGFYDNAVDFTDGNFNSNPDSVAVASAWKAVVPADINALNDFRETKGYAIHTSQSNAPYDGFQNSTGATPAPVLVTTVAAATQPANSIAPANAQRVPFTAFTITANASSSVTINSISVQRQGASASSDFSGVELIDPSTGLQLGPSVTLDGSGNATVGAPVVIAAGASKTFLIAANIAPAPGSGDVAVFAVTAVNTPSTLSGNLPIIGASNTINSSLTIGSAVVQASLLDPNSATVQPIGTNGYRFSAFRIIAGSVEDISLKAITWYQSGSAFGLANVVTVVNGTSYPTSVDGSGHFYTTIFPSTIVIPKSNSLDVSVQGDIGSSAIPNSIAEFDVYRNTDIYLIGNTYGYGIGPTIGSFGTINGARTHASSFAPANSFNPFFQGSTVTIVAPAGTLTVSTDASSPSYTLVAGGTTGVTTDVLKLHAANEAVYVQKIGLALTNGAPADVTQTYIYAGTNVQTPSGTAIPPGTLLGTATFTGSTTSATSTLNTLARVSNNADATLIIKSDLAAIGTSQPGTEGDLVAINYLNAQGTGELSGNTVNGFALNGSGSAGVRTFKTIPTIALDTTLPSTGVADGRLMEFKVTANSQGNLGLNKVTFAIATTTATVTNLQLFVYSDSGYSQAVSGTFGASTGQFGSTVASVSNAPFVITATTNPIEVPAGSTYYFQLHGTVAGVQVGSSVVTTLKGDSAFDGMKTASSVSGNMVWSPNATGISAASQSDWTNAFGVTGLPTSGITQTRSN